MAKLGQYTAFSATQTKKIVDRKKKLNEEHIRIAKSMLHSKAFKKLTKNELQLYFELRLKFYKEEGRREEFELSQSFATRLLGLYKNSNRSGERAITGLTKKGFIEPTYISKGGGKKTKKPNRFKFSENWKELE